jgi:hypothetical protein
MTASTNLVHIVSTTQPTGLNLGDEWYNPTTNTLYKNLLVNGTTTLVNQLPASANTRSNISMPTGTGTAAVQGLSTNIASGNVAPSTSGTSINFTDIPSWVKRITLMFNGFSTNGSSSPQVQIGAGSILTTTYLSGAAYSTGVNTTGVLNSTTGFVIGGVSSTNIRYGHMILTNVGGGVWVSSNSGGFSDTAGAFNGGGNVTLSGTLDRVRVTTVSGTDTFDAGTIGILYE